MASIRKTNPVLCRWLFASAVIWGIVAAAHPAAADTGFTAAVEGAKTASINAPGTFFCLQGFESPVGKMPEAIVVADSEGERRAGLTFVVPIATAPGSYALTEVHPFHTRTKPNVRVEIDSTVEYFDKKTEGTLVIEALPDGYGGQQAARVKGSFDFETENAKGARVRIKGKFDFPAPVDAGKYCAKNPEAKRLE